MISVFCALALLATGVAADSVAVGPSPTEAPGPSLGALSIRAGLVRTDADVSRMSPTVETANRSLKTTMGDGWHFGMVVDTPVAGAVGWRFGVLAAVHRLQVAEEGFWSDAAPGDNRYFGTRTVRIREKCVELPIGLVIALPKPGGRAGGPEVRIALGFRIDLHLGQDNTVQFDGDDRLQSAPISRSWGSYQPKYRNGVKADLGAELEVPTGWRPVSLAVHWAVDLRSRLAQPEGYVGSRIIDDFGTILWRDLREQTLSVSAGVAF